VEVEPGGEEFVRMMRKEICEDKRVSTKLRSPLLRMPAALCNAAMIAALEKEQGPKELLRFAGGIQ
jgi:hypothetical protein